MLRVLQQGEFFGELALLSPGQRNATALALDPTETLAISKDLLEQLRARCPGIDCVVVEALASEVRRLAAALTEALYLPADRRLLRRLAELTSLFNDGNEPPSVIPLTQEELAQIAGLTRPTANRILKGAESDGILRVTRGKVEILDVEALVRRSR